MQRRTGRAVDVGGEPRLEPIEVDSLRRVRHAGGHYALDTRCAVRLRCVLAGVDGLAVAAGVAGDPADGHVDAEAGGGALFFGLATPEAVLAVLARPVAAVGAATSHARQTARALRLADGAGLGPFARRREEQPALPVAGGLGRPGQWTGEDQVGDRLGGHGAHSPCGDVPGSERGVGGGNRPRAH